MFPPRQVRSDGSNSSLATVGWGRAEGGQARGCGARRRLAAYPRNGSNNIRGMRRHAASGVRSAVWCALGLRHPVVRSFCWRGRSAVSSICPAARLLQARDRLPPQRGTRHRHTRERDSPPSSPPLQTMVSSAGASNRGLVVAFLFSSFFFERSHAACFEGGYVGEGTREYKCRFPLVPVLSDNSRLYVCCDAEDPPPEQVLEPREPLCFREPVCGSFADDCCAPFDEEKWCTVADAFPVDTGLGCAGLYDHGDFVCCLENYEPIDVALLVAERDEVDVVREGCGEDFEGGSKCFKHKDCQGFLQPSPGSCYVGKGDDAVCCGIRDVECCHVNFGAVAGLIFGIAATVTGVCVGFCRCTRSCCFKKRPSTQQQTAMQQQVQAGGMELAQMQMMGHSDGSYPGSFMAAASPPPGAPPAPRVGVATGGVATGGPPPPPQQFRIPVAHPAVAAADATTQQHSSGPILVGSQNANAHAVSADSVAYVTAAQQVGG